MERDDKYAYYKENEHIRMSSLLCQSVNKKTQSKRDRVTECVGFVFVVCFGVKIKFKTNLSVLNS